MIPGVVASQDVGPPDMVLEQSQQTQTAAAPTSVSATLAVAPTTGNTLLTYVRTSATTGGGKVATYSATGTLLASADNGDAMSWALYASESAGTETTHTVTFSTSPAGNAIIDYQEWSGLDFANLFDAVNSTEVEEFAVTTHNPPAVTADQARAVYPAFIGLTGSSGTVTADWTDVTANRNFGQLFAAHKIDTAGTGFDSAALTWTNSRTVGGVIAALRGAS